MLSTAVVPVQANSTLIALYCHRNLNKLQPLNVALSLHAGEPQAAWLIIQPFQTVVWLHYSAIVHGCGLGSASRSNFAFWCTRQFTISYHVISTKCASEFRRFPTFLLSVLLLVAIWSYREQGYSSATGHFVWLVRSPGTVFHWTFVRRLHYQRSNTCSRHICSLVPTSLTDCFQSTSSEHCTAPLQSLYSHVTAPYELSFYYYYYLLLLLVAGGICIWSVVNSPFDCTLEIFLLTYLLILAAHA